MTLVMGNVKVNKEIYKDVLDHVDQNQDGEISYNEFLTAAINKNTFLTHENLSKAFRFLDEDSNGKITS